MSRRRNPWLVSTAVGVAAMVIGCSGHRDPVEFAQGRWRCSTSLDPTPIWEIDVVDGAFTSKVTMSQGAVVRDRGRWSLDDGELRLRWDGGRSAAMLFVDGRLRIEPGEDTEVRYIKDRPFDLTVISDDRVRLRPVKQRANEGTMSCRRRTPSP